MCLVWETKLFNKIINPRKYQMNGGLTLRYLCVKIKVIYKVA